MKYTGGCHCGRVKYEVEVDLAKTLVCNCSHCEKRGFILSFVPGSHFTLLSGDDHLTEYRFNKKHIAHLFCRTCGVESFGRGQNQKGEPTVMVNVRCLDGVDLSTLQSKEFDGKSM